ncbi:HisA/HisF-related TIM barrel protein [Candidatus Vidania fulgoroideorum]
MQIIPAIDIYKKKIVRLLKGNFNKIHYFKKKFKNFLKYFLKNKIKNINLIDLEGALKKKTKNKKLISSIIKKLKKNKINSNIGGGIRKIKTIKYYLNIGANKIILGTAVIKNISFFKKIYYKYKKKIMISLDIKKGHIMLNGWKEKYINLKKFMKKIKFYKNEIIVTNIDKDGTLKGIDLKFNKKILKIIKKNKIIFSGGYLNKNYTKIKNMSKRIKGYIIGKYLYKKIENDF